MFNLLAQKSIIKVKKDYFLRKVVVISLFVIFVEVCLLVFLFPTWLVSKRLESEALTESLRVEELLARSDSSPMIEVITDLNRKLSLIDTTLKYKYTVPIIDSILGEQNVDIKIRSFFYTSKTATSSVVNLEGVSTGRDSLVSFVKRLESTGKFETVQLPISNFAQGRNIIFNLELVANE